MTSLDIVGKRFYLITSVIEYGEGHRGHVDEGFGKEPAVDGQQDCRQKGKVAQDKKQRFGKKKSLKNDKLNLVLDRSNN